MRLSNQLKTLFVLALITYSSVATAYSSITVFGDSFSDGGNSDTAVISYYKLTGNTSITPPPYADYRFSNGPVAVEYLATGLGLNNTSHFFNYAVGGATTKRVENIVSNIYLPSHASLDGDALFVLTAGANDLRNTSLSSTTDSTIPANDAIIDKAVTNLTNTLISLHDKGAQHFLLLNLPILGFVPGDPNADTTTIQNAVNITFNFNRSLSANIGNLSFSSQVNMFDMVAFFDKGSAEDYGIVNVRDTCLANGVACKNPDQYAFWDSLHLTTKVNGIIGQALLTSLVPEPNTYAMLLGGLSVIGFTINRPKKSSLNYEAV